MQGEVSKSNMTNLVLAQQLIKSNALAARYLLGIGERETEFLVSLGPSAMQRLADSGTLLFNFRFSGESLPKLQAYLDGDYLAFTQAEMASFVGMQS